MIVKGEWRVALAAANHLYNVAAQDGSISVSCSATSPSCRSRARVKALLDRYHQAAK